MKANVRNLLWLLPLLLFVTSPLWKPPVAAFLTPRGGYNPKLAMPEESTPVQNFVMDSVAITLTSDGKEEWQIDAVSAMYIGKEKEPINITSQKGRYHLDDRHLTLIGKVVITKPTKDQQLFSELLHYYDATKMVVSPGKVDLRGPGLKLTAGRMDYDLTSEGYDFGDRVKVNM